MSDGRIEVIQSTHKLAAQRLEIAHLEGGKWEVDADIAERLQAFLNKHGTEVRVCYIRDGEERGHEECEMEFDRLRDALQRATD